jgi:hypothetical protein
MKKSETTKSMIRPYGGIIVIIGVVLFGTGIILRNFSPGTLADTRLLEGFGILLTGWGIVPLVRIIQAHRNPKEARRALLAENDERAAALRNKAGYAAFLFSMVINNAILITYSAMTRGETGFDPLWVALIFLVISPVMVFTAVMLWQNRVET